MGCSDHTSEAEHAIPSGMASRTASACSLTSSASSAPPNAFEMLRRRSDDAPGVGSMDEILLGSLLADLATPVANPSEWASVPSSPAASEASLLPSGFAVARGHRTATGSDGNATGDYPL